MSSERSEFVNEPLVDFSQVVNKDQMVQALQRVEEEKDRVYDLLIGGERVKSGEVFTSLNPTSPSQTVGTVARATGKELDRALDAAEKAFETWKMVSAAERADLLFRAAAIMRRRRMELSACMVLEVGKSWVEADADTAEAIDFLDFYGREALRYAEEQPITPLPGERNEMFYIPLGVGAVIPPWNFPCAILVGMTAAAIVAGNTVVLKPSSDAPLTAYHFFKILEDAALPPGVVNFLTGPGSSAGDALVQHPKTRFICFTGSKEVGLRINEQAAFARKGQIWIKRVIAEMGGKDTIIVEEDCDLEKAATGVTSSAFGYQGQKCSACSRVIVNEKIYDKFTDMLVERAKDIPVGPSRDSGGKPLYMGPVINEASERKIIQYIETGKREGRLVWGGEKASGNGFFIQPTVIADVPPDAKISLEEIFGPVLAIIKSRSYEESLKIANNTEYGLTGSVYTKDRKKMHLARRDFHVGNLYFNRKCTGALVGVHPFGGFNMSGTDSKAGGRDYLLLFSQAKAVSEVVS